LAPLPRRVPKAPGADGPAPRHPSAEVVGMQLACGGGASETGEGFSSAITEDGVLLAFGCGDKGQLGNGRYSLRVPSVHPKPLVTSRMCFVDGQC